MNLETMCILSRIRYNPFQKARSLLHAEYLALGCVSKRLLLRLCFLYEFSKEIFGVMGIMLSSFRKLSGRFPSQDVGGLVRSSTFFILFYLYLWLDVDLRLIYHGGGVIANFPAFYRGWAFFRQFTSYPGGLLEYSAALLSQFFYIGWAGPLVVTLQAWLICVCIGCFIKAINAPFLRWLRFIPMILLLVIYNQYTYHFTTTLALLAALLFVCLYLKTAPTNNPLSLAVFLVLSVIFYYIAAGAYLYFAVLCVIYELLFRHRWQMGLLFLISAAAIPYVEGILVFSISMLDAFTDLLPVSWKVLDFGNRKKMVSIVFILYLLLPLTAIAFGLWQMSRKTILTGLWNRKAKSGKQKRKDGVGPLSSAFKLVIESLVLFAIAVASVFFSHDSELKTLFAVDYYACHRMWPQVLKAARGHPNNPVVVHAVNRALYHTGRLDYDMFCYPQHPDTLLLSAQEYNSAYWKKFDVYLDIGFVNVAENDLTECLEELGERPIILQRLALINMVKGNIGTARIYLGALSKTFFHSEWANNYLARLQSEPDLSTDERIQRLRSVSMDKDHGSFFFAKEEMLLALLEKNSQNRMAFEYLMAWYMLTKQLDKFIQNIKRLNDFDYPEVPRIYEEAILVYVSGTKKSVDLAGRQLNPLLLQRMNEFSLVFNRYGRNKQAAFKELLENYGDTYFFYHVYGLSELKQ